MNEAAMDCTRDGLPSPNGRMAKKKNINGGGAKAAQKPDNASKHKSIGTSNMIITLERTKHGNGNKARVIKGSGVQWKSWRHRYPLASIFRPLALVSIKAHIGLEQ